MKGVITWVGASDGVRAPVRLYDRLFKEAQPDGGGKDFIAALNTNSLQVVEAMLEPSLAQATPGTNFQFERLATLLLTASLTKSANPFSIAAWPQRQLGTGRMSAAGVPLIVFENRGSGGHR